MAQNIMVATSALPAVLVSQQMANTETIYYTASAATSVKIVAASVCNTSGGAVTVSVSLIKTGGTAGNTNRVASFSLAAGDSSVLSELVGAFLGPGDFISAIASAATSVALVFSGVVYS